MSKPPPVPADFVVALDPGTRRPRPELLMGGAPIRLLRLSRAGVGLLDRWLAGEPVGETKAARALARKLFDAGIAHPRPGFDHRFETAVVIPARDDPSGLDATLQALRLVAPTVVVDDGSIDPVCAANARVIRHDTPSGPAAARNHGWRCTSAEIVVFLDAGCVPPEEWLATLLRHFSDPAVGAVAPRVVTSEEGSAPRWLAAYERRRSSLDLGAREALVRPGSRVPYVPSAALAVRRAALEEAGGFDESLRYGEDVDLVWRLQERGWTTRYEPAVSVTHPVRPTLGAWIRQRYGYGSSAAPLAARHGRNVAPVAVSPWSALVWGLVAAGQPAAAVAVGVSTSMALALRARKDRQAASNLVGLALTGNLRAGAALANATRRAWLPPLFILAVLCRRLGYRTPMRALAVALTAPVLEWRPDPAGGLDPLRWMALRLADDLAYQAGVWWGVIGARSPAALVPNW